MVAPQPMTPPTTTTATKVGPTAQVVRQEGELLVVSHGARLGGACVKCATMPVARTRFELLEQPGQWWKYFFFAGLLWLLWLFVEGLRLREAGVFLPVCAECDARWQRAVRRRSRVALALVPVTFGAMGALFAEARGWLPAGAGGWVGLALALVWAVAYLDVRLRTGRRWRVTAVRIERDLIWLRGVHPDALPAMVANAHALRSGT
jgi:hypothetical protein